MLGTHEPDSLLKSGGMSINKAHHKINVIYHPHACGCASPIGTFLSVWRADIRKDGRVYRRRRALIIHKTGELLYGRQTPAASSLLSGLLGGR